MLISRAHRSRRWQVALLFTLVASSLVATISHTAGAGTVSLPQVTPVPSGAGTNPEAVLESMSCVGDTCVSLGSYADSNGIGRPYAVITVDGSIFGAEELPNPSGASVTLAIPVIANAVSCVAGMKCLIVGTYTSSGHQYAYADSLVVTKSNGVPYVGVSQITSEPLPSGASTTATIIGTGLVVACPSSTECVVSGNYSTQANMLKAYVDVWNGSTWSAPQVAPAPSNALDAGLWVPESVSCWSPTGCELLGEYRANGASLEFPVGLPLVNGAVGTPLALPVPSDATTVLAASTIRHVSGQCFSATSCLVVGSYNNNHTPSPYTETFADTLSGTSWTTSTVPVAPNSATSISQAPTSLSCLSIHLCVMSGTYHSTNQILGVVWEYVNGAWDTPDQTAMIPGDGTASPQIDAVSCLPNYVCTYAGSLVSAQSNQDAVVGRYFMSLPAGATNVNAVQTGISTAAITWSPPSVTGAGIATYTVTRSGSGSAICVTSLTSCVDSSVAAGKTYTYTVTAVSADGQELPAATKSLTVLGLPGTPTHVSATSGVKSLTIKWSAGDGPTASSFTITVVQSHTTHTYSVSGSTRSIIATGLTAKVLAHVSVRANNAAGMSPTASVVGTPKA